MRTIFKFAILIITLSNFSCSYNRILLQENNRHLRNQHEYLKKESSDFLSQSQQSDFEKNLMTYLKEYKKYDFSNGRENISMLKPLIVNDHNSVIVLIGLRKNDTSGKDVDYVKFISAKFENNTWTFGVKDGFVYSFIYMDSVYPRLTNEQLAKNAIRNLMLEGFFRNNLSDKSIFKSPWYVF